MNEHPSVERLEALLEANKLIEQELDNEYRRIDGIYARVLKQFDVTRVKLTSSKRKREFENELYELKKRFRTWSTLHMISWTCYTISTIASVLSPGGWRIVDLLLGIALVVTAVAAGSQISKVHKNFERRRDRDIEHRTFYINYPGYINELKANDISPSDLEDGFIETVAVMQQRALTLLEKHSSL